MNRGKYIVLEGPEGVGKTTQIQELARRLQSAGLPVRLLREPDSQSDLTARALRQLTQDPHYPMNTQAEVLLYNAARSQSLQVVKNSVEQGVICIVDRNYLTTLAIQYYGRGDVPDYETINRIISFAVNGVEPDLCIVMDAPITVLKERAKHRGQGERFDNLDEAFLERVRAGYLWEAKQRNLPVVFATEDEDTIANNIWKLVAETLSMRTVSAAAVSEPMSVKEIIDQKKQSTPILDLPAIIPNSSLAEKKVENFEQLVHKNENGSFSMTDTGRQWLETAVSNVSGDVYAVLPKLDSLTVAAAMARLSRRGDDMRITILDEFAGKTEKDEQLLQRVITAFGDDSVQQLTGLHVVVENASNLLTKKLERGRLASYLEQSTRYIYYDQKDTHGRYRYFIPGELQGKTLNAYITTMDQIFDLYSKMVKNMTDHIRSTSHTPKAERDSAWRSATKAQACDAIRPVLPVATKSTVGIYASGQALEMLVMRLMSDDLPEARTVGQQILDESRKVISVFLERADKPERGGALIAFRANTRKAVQQLVDKYLSANHSSNQESVQLVDYSPRNELDIVPDMLYEQSDLPLVELQKAVTAWPYERKLEVFNAYIGERLNRRHRPGRALEKIHYSWDLLCDYGIFRDLQRHRMVDDLEWQALSPRYGYETPKIVEKAGSADDYEKCFDLSLQLYSQLQAAGYSLQAQYATLLGHKMRWKVTMNAREAIHFNELRTTPQGHPGYRKLVLQMHEKLAEVHPLIAGAMKFVNQDEDPELTRLAAERYTQFKMAQLDKHK